ncbi:MAG: putative Ig domain-containing protein, partial [Pirellulales bacterium]|nr:putative Ig domain-containing protein [Pirellulales bacterium]
TQNATEGTPLVLDIPGSDPNTGDVLTYTAQTPLPAGMTLNSATGRITWTPSESQGGTNYSITVRVQDSGGLFSDTTISGTVAEANTPPQAGSVAPLAATENVPLSVNVPFTDPDLPAQTLTYSLVSGPAGSAVNAQTGRFTWTPGEADGGLTRTAVIRATDSQGATAELTLTINVTEVNQPPVLNVETSFTIDELEAFTTSATATDGDTPTQTLTFSLVNAPTGMTINAATGEILWTPGEAQGPAQFNFSVRVTDNLGQFAQRQLTVTVSEVNTAPTLLNGGSTVNVFQGAIASMSVLATDGDLAAQTLTFDLINAPAGATINPLTGEIRWDTTGAVPGLNELVVGVTDSLGLSSTASFFIQVNNFNPGPIFALFSAPTPPINTPVVLDTAASSVDPEVVLSELVNVADLPPPTTPGNPGLGINEGTNRLQGVTEGVEQNTQKPVIDGSAQGDSTPEQPAEQQQDETPRPQGNPLENPFQSGEVQAAPAETQQSLMRWNEQGRQLAGMVLSRLGSQATPRQLQDLALAGYLAEGMNGWEAAESAEELNGVRLAPAQTTKALDQGVDPRLTAVSLDDARPMTTPGGSDRIARYAANTPLPLAAAALAALPAAVIAAKKSAPVAVPLVTEQVNNRRGGRYWLGKRG